MGHMMVLDLDEVSSSGCATTISITVLHARVFNVTVVILFLLLFYSSTLPL